MNAKQVVQAVLQQVHLQLAKQAGKVVTYRYNLNGAVRGGGGGAGVRAVGGPDNHPLHFRLQQCRNIVLQLTRYNWHYIMWSNSPGGIRVKLVRSGGTAGYPDEYTSYKRNLQMF